MLKVSRDAAVVVGAVFQIGCGDGTRPDDSAIGSAGDGSGLDDTGGGDSECTTTITGSVNDSFECVAVISDIPAGEETTLLYIRVADANNFSFRLFGLREPFPGTYTTQDVATSEDMSASGEYRMAGVSGYWSLLQDNPSGFSTGLPQVGEFDLTFREIEFARGLPIGGSGWYVRNGSLMATFAPGTGATGELEVRVDF